MNDLGMLFSPSPSNRKNEASMYNATKQPNILFLYVDNLGFGELGCYGGGALRGAPTPRLDALSAQGMRLTNMNMEAQCTPSRSAVMTGRMPVRSGTTRIPLPGRPNGLVVWEKTIAQLLGEAGYRTAHFGKWHLGSSQGRHPQDRGFDSWWGLLETHDSSLWSDAPGYDPSVVAPEKLLEAKSGQASQPIADYDQEQRALFDGEAFRRTHGFIRDSVESQQPFFAYVPLAFPHFPTLPHPDYAGITGNGDFADSFVETDTRVGQLLDLLDELGVADDTVVVFTSDNGAEDTLPWRGWTGPWGGSYFTAMEGCLRVPFLIRWPGKIAPGGVSNEVTHGVDLFTTFASMGGGSVPNDRLIDGVDLTPLFTGESSASGRESILCFVGDVMHAVKWRNWKLHYVWQEYMTDPPQPLPVPRAFNLLEDPRERHDVFLPSNTWLMRPVQHAIQAYVSSLEQFPLIAPGTPDPYTPHQ
jgi:arylsulfatase A-like enzyme